MNKPIALVPENFREIEDLFGLHIEISSTLDDYHLYLHRDNDRWHGWIKCPAWIIADDEDNNTICIWNKDIVKEYEKTSSNCKKSNYRLS